MILVVVPFLPSSVLIADSVYTMRLFCVWARAFVYCAYVQPTYPLPAGWVPVASGDAVVAASGGDADSDAGSRHEADEGDEENSPPRPAYGSHNNIKRSPAKTDFVVVVNKEKSNNSNKRKSVGVDGVVDDDAVDVENSTEVDTDSDSTNADTAAMPPPRPPPPPAPVVLPSFGHGAAKSSSSAASRTVVHVATAAAPPPSTRRRASTGVPPRVFASGNYGNHQQQQHIRRVVGSDISSAAAAAAVSALPRAAAAPRPPGVPNSKGGIGVGVRPPPGKLLMFENTWTGERVSQRPLYPVGPSEACVVSQVARALDPLSFLADPVKAKKSNKKASGGGGAGGGGEGSREVIGGGSSWSFSSFKSKGYAAAAECLAKCVDA